MVMLSKQERRAAAIYEATGEVYRAAQATGLSAAEVIHAVSVTRRMARKEGPVQRCRTCPWRRDGLEYCVLPHCMKERN